VPFLPSIIPPFLRGKLFAIKGFKFAEGCIACLKPWVNPPYVVVLCFDAVWFHSVLTRFTSTF
jgi:hypothetical protein